MPHLLKARRENVLEEPSYELRPSDGHLPPAVRAALAVRVRDLSVVARDDAPVTDGHAEDVRGRVFQRRPAVADRLRVNHPVLTPHRRIDLCQGAGTVQTVAELGAEEGRQGTHGHQEMG